MAYYNYSKGKQSSINLMPQDSELNIRKICLSRCNKNDNCSIYTKADYNPNSARGNISMKYLSTDKHVLYGFSESRVENAQKSTLKDERVVTLPVKVNKYQEREKNKKAIVKIRDDINKQHRGEKRKMIEAETRESSDLKCQSETKKKKKSSTTKVKESSSLRKPKIILPIGTSKQTTRIHNETKENKMVKQASTQEVPKTTISPDTSNKKKRVFSKESSDHMNHISPKNKIATIGESPPRLTVTGVAVSPEAPAPRALEFPKKDIKKPVASIKKFFQPGKASTSRNKFKTKKTESANVERNLECGKTSFNFKALNTKKFAKVDMGRSKSHQEKSPQCSLECKSF